MPWLSGFAGVDNYAKMGSDPRFWNSLALTVHLHRVDGRAAGRRSASSLALLVLQIPKGQGLLRVAAILPIVLAPVVVGLFWRTLVLAPDVGLVDMVTRALGLGSHNWLGDPQLALISVIAIHTWQWTPFAFLVLLATLVDAAARRLRSGAARPRRRLAALPPHHAAADPAGDRDGRHPAHDDRALGLRRDLRRDRRRARARRPRSSTCTRTARRSPSWISATARRWRWCCCRSRSRCRTLMFRLAEAASPRGRPAPVAVRMPASRAP